MADSVIDNPARNRFELSVGNALAVAEYRIEHGRVVLAHTEVPKELAGQGVGSRLAKGVLDAIRASGRRAALECDFMAAYVARHPEYADLVAS